MKKLSVSILALFLLTISFSCSDDEPQPDIEKDELSGIVPETIVQFSKITFSQDDDILGSIEPIHYSDGRVMEIDLGWGVYEPLYDDTNNRLLKIRLNGITFVDLSYDNNGKITKMEYGSSRYFIDYDDSKVEIATYEEEQSVPGVYGNSHINELTWRNNNVVNIEITEIPDVQGDIANTITLEIEYTDIPNYLSQYWYSLYWGEDIANMLWYDTYFFPIHLSENMPSKVVYNSSTGNKITTTYEYLLDDEGVVEEIQVESNDQYTNGGKVVFTKN